MGKNTQPESDQQPKQPRPPQKFMPNNQYFTISIYALIVIAIGALIARVIMTPHAVSNALKDFLGMLMPFLIGLLIAFILNPLIQWLMTILEKRCKVKSRKAQKILATVIAYITVLGLILICIIYIVPQIISSVTEVINGLPQLYKITYDFFTNLQERFPNTDVSAIQNAVNDTLPELISAIKDFASNLVPAIYTASVSIVNWLLNIIIAIIVSIYMLSDKKSLQHSMRVILYCVVPVKFIDDLMSILSESNKIFTNFIVGKAIDSSIIGVLCFILMNIFGLEYSLLISVIVGITNMIPYFGPFIGAIPGMVVLLMVSPLKSLGFGILILALQQFDGLYLGPKILGDTVGLKPLWIIIAISLGGNVAGVLGMFLSVPVFAVIRYLLGLFIEYRLKKRNFKAEDIA